MAYECSECGTRTEELRGVTYKGIPAGDYCRTCFLIGSPARAYLVWDNCPVTKSTVESSE